MIRDVIIGYSLDYFEKKYDINDNGYEFNSIFLNYLKHHEEYVFNLIQKKINSVDNIWVDFKKPSNINLSINEIIKSLKKNIRYEPIADKVLNYKFEKKDEEENNALLMILDFISKYNMEKDKRKINTLVIRNMPDKDEIEF